MPDSAIPFTAARQAPVSMRFSRQGCWNQSFPSPGDLPNPGIEPGSPVLQADSLPTELQGKPVGSVIPLKLLFLKRRCQWSTYTQLFCFVFRESDLLGVFVLIVESLAARICTQIRRRQQERAGDAFSCVCEHFLCCPLAHSLWSTASPELLLTLERAHLGLNIRDLRFFKGESKA